MARARNIKPGFFKNEELVALGAEAMLLFAGLWTLADRAGRLEDRPKRIKAEIFPYWPKIQIDKVLDCLNKAGFIVRYESGEDRYITIPNFVKHQNPHKKEVASTIPAPVEQRASTVQDREIPERAALVTDSLLLIPSTTTPPPKVVSIEFPKSSEFIKRKFPMTDDAMVRSIVDRAVQEVIGAGEQPELVTDEVLLEALRECTGPKQYSAALYLQTVGTWMRNKASTEAYE